jgi:hypothetical protein
MIHVIKFYRQNTQICNFIGDDETISNTLVNLNFQSILPSDIVVTKTNSEHREYKFSILDGGYSWSEVDLNNPKKELD